MLFSYTHAISTKMSRLAWMADLSWSINSPFSKREKCSNSFFTMASGKASKRRPNSKNSIRKERKRESQEGLLRSREKGRIAHVFTFNAFSSTVFLLSSFLMAKLTFNLKGPFIRLTKSEIQLYMKYLPGMPVEMGPGKMESFDVLSKNGKYKRSAINEIRIKDWMSFLVKPSVKPRRKTGGEDDHDVPRSCEQTRSASLDTYAYL